MMALFIVQLAKMTLVVLGIFFTPMITRKFVQQLRLPAAQEMMKWGSLGIGLASTGALKTFAAGAWGGRGAKDFLKRELPSTSFHTSQKMEPIFRKLAGNQSSALSRVGKLLSAGTSKSNELIQKGHLLDEARKEGLHIPTRKEKRAARFDPRMREKVDAAQERLSQFIKARKGFHNPVTGEVHGVYVPPDQRLVSGARAVSNLTKSGARFTIQNAASPSLGTYHSTPERNVSVNVTAAPSAAPIVPQASPVAPVSRPAPSDSISKQNSSAGVRPNPTRDSFVERTRVALRTDPIHISKLLDRYKEKP